MTCVVIINFKDQYVLIIYSTSEQLKWGFYGELRETQRSRPIWLRCYYKLQKSYICYYRCSRFGMTLRRYMICKRIRTCTELSKLGLSLDINNGGKIFISVTLCLFNSLCGFQCIIPRLEPQYLSPLDQGREDKKCCVL